MSGLVKRKFFTRFTPSNDGAGAWAKPSGVTIVWIECIGGGGAGGGGEAANIDSAHYGGGGGGGGAYSFAVFNAADLPNSLDIVVAGAATGGTGGTAAANNTRVPGTDGNSGDPSYVDIPSGETDAG